MNTPSQSPGNQPTKPTDFSEARGDAFLIWMFGHLKELYLFGGLALVLIGAVAASNANMYGSGMGFAGLGVCIAGGLCFVASAIIHTRDTSR